MKPHPLIILISILTAAKRSRAEWKRLSDMLAQLKAEEGKILQAGELDDETLGTLAHSRMRMELIPRKLIAIEAEIEALTEKAKLETGRLQSALSELHRAGSEALRARLQSTLSSFFPGSEACSEAVEKILPETVLGLRMATLVHCYQYSLGDYLAGVEILCRAFDDMVSALVGHKVVIPESHADLKGKL
jgi:hypothetical protein